MLKTPQSTADIPPQDQPRWHNENPSKSTSGSSNIMKATSKMLAFLNPSGRKSLPPTTRSDEHCSHERNSFAHANYPPPLQQSNHGRQRGPMNGIEHTNPSTFASYLQNQPSNQTNKKTDLKGRFGTSINKNNHNANTKNILRSKTDSKKNDKKQQQQDQSQVGKEHQLVVAPTERERAKKRLHSIRRKLKTCDPKSPYYKRYAPLVGDWRHFLPSATSTSFNSTNFASRTIPSSSLSSSSSISSAVVASGDSVEDLRDAYFDAVQEPAYTSASKVTRLGYRDLDQQASESESVGTNTTSDEEDEEGSSAEYDTMEEMDAGSDQWARRSAASLSKSVSTVYTGLKTSESSQLSALKELLRTEELCRLVSSTSISSMAKKDQASILGNGSSFEEIISESDSDDSSSGNTPSSQDDSDDDAFLADDDDGDDEFDNCRTLGSNKVSSNFVNSVSYAPWENRPLTLASTNNATIAYITAHRSDETMAGPIRNFTLGSNDSLTPLMEEDPVVQYQVNQTTTIAAPRRPVPPPPYVLNPEQAPAQPQQQLLPQLPLVVTETILPNVPTVKVTDNGPAVRPSLTLQTLNHSLGGIAPGALSAFEKRPLGSQHSLTKCNSTSSLYIDSTMTKGDVDETLRAVAAVLYGKVVHSHNTNDCRTERIINSSSYIPGTPKVLMTQSDIFDFMRFIFDCGQNLGAENAVITLIYIERMLQLGQLSFHAINWRRILLGALILSIKVWEDLAVFNSDVCAIFEGLSVRDVNALERFSMAKLQYNVSVKRSVYATYYFRLRDVSEANSNLQYGKLTMSMSLYQGLEESMPSSATSSQPSSHNNLLSLHGYNNNNYNGSSHDEAGLASYLSSRRGSACSGTGTGMGGMGLVGSNIPVGPGYRKWTLKPLSVREAERLEARSSLFCSNMQIEGKDRKDAGCYWDEYADAKNSSPVVNLYLSSAVSSTILSNTRNYSNNNHNSNNGNTATLTTTASGSLSSSSNTAMTTSTAPVLPVINTTLDLQKSTEGLTNSLLMSCSSSDDASSTSGGPLSSNASSSATCFSAGGEEPVQNNTDSEGSESTSAASAQPRRVLKMKKSRSDFFFQNSTPASIM